ncbi:MULTISPECIES: response regulator [Hallerella]|uniref:Response regulator receiver domain-containing protein n=1 Tax=Hallerella succinigenes TaxID=1896222 RepID=A0A2M9AAP4_9BACT|nr:MULTISPECIES: response regulator [Hallerella]MCI6874033.1 response regulator [Hallerella sp.]MDD6092534.1 response regulator [Hallerella succinigenes]MDY5029099.1 response regulator [Hallerella succinigenes]PJJ42792.1 response regulator receiver domain-containing protein [Hallerella succinigenes]
MPKVLIIDDEKDIRSVLKDMLGMSGYDVDTAEDGRKAKELYDKTDYDVVITDIIMPEQDGFEVILDYRNKNQLDRIIAISGGGRTSSEDYLNIASHFGVSSIFSKPPNYKDLIAKVDEIVASHA